MIDYVVNMVGIDHVGFGLDLAPQMSRELYDHFNRIYPEMFKDSYEDRNFLGLTDYDCVIDITRGLVARGYSDGDITKINGGNWLRLFEQTWHHQPQIQRSDEENVLVEDYIDCRFLIIFLATENLRLDLSIQNVERRRYYV
jgi:hypothetical protein